MSISICRLLAKLGQSKLIIYRRLHELVKINRRCREVPCETTSKQMNRIIDICQKLLTYPNENDF